MSEIAWFQHSIDVFVGYDEGQVKLRVHLIRATTTSLCGIVLLGCSSRSSHVRPPKSSSLPVRRLALDEVLSWRKYAYLIGITEQQARDILGEPREQALWQDGVHLTFQHAKMDNRLATLCVVNSRVKYVEVYPKPDEVFDISELIAHADQFTFASGIAEGSTESFLDATKNNLTIRIMTTRDDSALHPILDSVLLH